MVLYAKKRKTIIGTTYYAMVRHDGVFYGNTTAPFVWARETLCCNFKIIFKDED